MCTFFFIITIDHHNDLQMYSDWAISLNNSPPPYLVSIWMIRLYHCIRNNQISWKQVWNRLNRISDGWDFIKTIMAWWTAQIQSQIWLHVRLATLDPIPRLMAWLKLGLGQLSSWQVGPIVLTCQLTGCWLTCLCHMCVMLTSSLSESCTWVGSSIRSAHLGEEDACHAWGAYVSMSDVRFRRRFHQWLRLFLLYTVVWSKYNFDNFYF